MAAGANQNFTFTVTLPKTVTGARLLSQEISQPLVWTRTSSYQFVFPPVEAGMFIANPRANYHLLDQPDCPSFTQEVWFRTSSAGVVRAYSNVPGTATNISVVRLDAGTSGYLVFSIRGDANRDGHHGYESGLGSRSDRQFQGQMALIAGYNYVLPAERIALHYPLGSR